MHLARWGHVGRFTAETHQKLYLNLTDVKWPQILYSRLFSVKILCENLSKMKFVNFVPSSAHPGIVQFGGYTRLPNLIEIRH